MEGLLFVSRRGQQRSSKKVSPKLKVFCSIGFWTTLFIFSQTFTQVHSSGVFQIWLKSFINQYGQDVNSHCCETEFGLRSEDKASSTEICTRTCRTYFIICLKEFRREIDLDSECTYGWYKSPVVESNSFNSSSDGAAHFTVPISFNFSFSWPGDFSLVVEAWHDSTSYSRLGKKHEDKLIMRLATQSSLRVGEHWTNNVSRTDQTTLRYSYRVVCESTYYGEDCATLCKPRDDQLGHYTCNTTSGAKICHPGWESDYCTKPICLAGCQHGDCKRPGHCDCRSGWKGRLCDQCEVYPGCQHGSCGGKPWKCECEEGWGGLLCNQDLNYCTNHKPCKNDGICENTGKGFYTCKCPFGFTGTNCETPVSSCAQQPCANGGTCKSVGSSNYTCDCPLGFNGKHCENLASTCTENPCQHGGTCVDGPGGYLCACRPGYKGKDCEIQQTDCDPNPCANGGNCVKDGNGYQCQCRAGFDGPNCEHNINDCAESPCRNGATCVDEVNSFRCKCVPGFTGSLCESNVDDCKLNPCANGGSCVDLINSYQCTCAPGFAGHDCSINIDDCASNPCMNGGNCIDRVDEFQCECISGYFGLRCEYNENNTNDVISGNTNSEGVASGGVRISLQKSVERNSVPSSASGLSNDLSPEKVALISFTSAIVPVMVIIAVCIVWLFKRQKHRKERQRREDEDEVRRQNEQNSANLHNSKAKKNLETGANVIVNSLDKAPSLYHLNRQKSATLSKLSNEDYESSIYARQVAVVNESNKSASLLRTKSNNKLTNIVNSECAASNNQFNKRPMSKVIIERENKSISLHPDAVERRDSLPHLQSVVPNGLVKSESIHSLARAVDRDSISSHNNHHHHQQHTHTHNNNNNSPHSSHPHFVQQPSRSSGRSVHSVYVIDDQIYSQPAFVADPQQKLFATQV